MVKNELIEAMKHIPKYTDVKKIVLTEDLQRAVMQGHTRLRVFVYGGIYFNIHDVIDFCEENNLSFKKYKNVGDSDVEIVIYWDEEL